MVQWNFAAGFELLEKHQELGVSLCKITRGSRELKKTDSAFKSMLNLRDQLFNQETPRVPKTLP